MRHRYSLFRQIPQRHAFDPEAIELLNLCDACSSEDENEDILVESASEEPFHSFALEFATSPIITLTHEVRKSFRERPIDAKITNAETRLARFADNAGTVAAVPVAYAGALIMSVVGLFAGAACDAHQLIMQHYENRTIRQHDSTTRRPQPK